MEFKITVIDQRLLYLGKLPTIISGSQDFIRLVFDFRDEVWNDLKIVAHFHHNEDKCDEYEVVDGAVTLPGDLSSGLCALALQGFDAESKERITIAGTLVFEVQ